MKKMRFALYTSVVLLATACFNAPKYSEVPEIELSGVRTATSPVSPGDSVVLILKFKDGDGDLGKANSSDTIPNFFITDSRFNVIDSQNYSVPNIPQKGSVKDISGTIEVNILAKIFCNPLTPGISGDTLIFDVRVRDRSGNFSNSVKTPPIFVKCN
jgi:hypothetical protein